MPVDNQTANTLVSAIGDPYIAARLANLVEYVSFDSSGNATTQSIGNLTYATGSITVSAGNLTLTAGNLTVSAGNIVCSAGQLTLGAKITASDTIGVGCPVGTQASFSAKVQGSLIYNSATNKLNFWNGSAWEAVTSA